MSLYTGAAFDYYKSMKTLRLALAQINPTVGDLGGNAKKIIKYIREAKAYGADIVAFPELAVTGYPPEDLLLKPRFIADNLAVLEEVRQATEGISAVVGFVDRLDDIYNSAAVMADRAIVDVYHKTYLPNYGTFDEYRYFRQGNRCPVYRVGDTLVGVNICEDIWYPEGPSRLQALAGAELVININASPYATGKGTFREQMLSTRAADSAVIIAYLNMVGGQDELVFDGGSFVINERSEVIARAGQFEEDLLVVDLDIEAVFLRRLHDPRRRAQVGALGKDDVQTVELAGTRRRGRKKPRKRSVEVLGQEEEVYGALVLGVSDYVRKNSFKGALIGLSGGIDSALVAAVAVDALGRENLRCLYMPSPYSSPESGEDARELARNLGVKLTEIPITPIFESYLGALRKHFRGLKPDTTEENLQARIRGNILMAHSNKLGSLVLTTGNKSEMSVGYATLYGDMAGGFAVIKDVPKTLAYRLAEWRNGQAGHDLIPARILSKPPSAELRPEQRDTDALPPYEVLDPILKAYVEEEHDIDDIVAFYGCEPECTETVINMIDLSEYKRRQSPPGIKITPRAFGRDRRFPITNRYRVKLERKRRK
jgi:NAD+ synthase (glutamine-hydrolysing)